VLSFHVHDSYSCLADWPRFTLKQPQPSPFLSAKLPLSNSGSASAIGVRPESRFARRVQSSPGAPGRAHGFLQLRAIRAGLGTRRAFVPKQPRETGIEAHTAFGEGFRTHLAE
jgi:hypothetical protein